LRSILGCFLFSGEEVFKKIKVLSGGEKSRVALAKVLISQANFLLLDEPTNHLDMQSVNILIQALQQYEGTYVVVSHDRYFVSNIANKIWYIEDYEIKEYHGSFDEYEEWQESRKGQQATKPQESQKLSAPEKVKSTVEKTVPKAVNNQKMIEKIEHKIFDLESQKDQIENEMAEKAQNNQFEEMNALENKLKDIQISLEKITLEWESLIE
jgi:ATP-binding cassette subfamily F protein 3